MTTPDHDAVDALYAAAEAATPGPWRAEYSEPPTAKFVLWSRDRYPIVLAASLVPAPYDAAFLAAADPTTIRALIDRLRAVEAALERQPEELPEPIGRVRRKWWRLGWLSAQAVARAALRSRP